MWKTTFSTCWFGYWRTGNKLMNLSVQITTSGSCQRLCPSSLRYPKIEAEFPASSPGWLDDTDEGYTVFGLTHEYRCGRSCHNKRIKLNQTNHHVLVVGFLVYSFEDWHLLLVAITDEQASHNGLWTTRIGAFSTRPWVVATLCERDQFTLCQGEQFESWVTGTCLHYRIFGFAVHIYRVQNELSEEWDWTARDYQRVVL